MREWGLSGKVTIECCWGTRPSYFIRSENGQLAERTTNMPQNSVAMKPVGQQHNAIRNLLPMLKTFYINQAEFNAIK